MLLNIVKWAIKKYSYIVTYCLKVYFLYVSVYFEVLCF
jgi:hypothetical protein